jgi:hypothetical protein
MLFIPAYMGQIRLNNLILLEAHVASALNVWKQAPTEHVGQSEKWSHVYFRHRFFPFTSTTRRSEGLNSYFKKLVRPSESMWKFVQQYELCQNLMLDREDNAGFTMETTGRPLWGRLDIYNFLHATYFHFLEHWHV